MTEREVMKKEWKNVLDEFEIKCVSAAVDIADGMGLRGGLGESK